MEYRKLNQWTKRNAYPISRISAVFEVMKRAVVFSKFDIKFANNLVWIREGDKYKMAFNTKFGHFAYLMMLFGLINRPAVFRRFINDIFSEDIGKCYQIYFDDIVVYSKTLEEHVQHVRKILKKLIEHKFVVKMSKYKDIISWTCSQQRWCRNWPRKDKGRDRMAKTRKCETDAKLCRLLQILQEFFKKFLRNI